MNSASNQTPQNTVVLSGLGKTYRKGTFTAVQDATFSVDHGELFGLIGPDGAGKTSIFRMLATLVLPDNGSASLAGYDVVSEYRTIRNIIGYMPGRFSLYQDLTVVENLNFFATLFGTTIEEHYDLIHDIYVQLEPFKDRRAGKLSGGMKQKLALCCALVHEPRVLLLDEPTTGVDPVSRNEFWAILQRLKERGITILVSTPYMNEALLCDRIALIDKGAILSVDTPQAIMHAFDTQLYKASSATMLPLRRELLALPVVERAYTYGEELHMTLHKDVEISIADLEAQLRTSNILDAVIEVTSPTIEDCFIRLMGS